MISTGEINNDDSNEEYDGKFVIDTEDDTAFFNMDLGGTFGNKNSLKTDSFGGFKTNWSPGTTKSNYPTAQPANTTDPSKCDKNCASCVWATFCKSATKGLSALASGGFIPKLG